MKACTDIEQSRKLAEILPHESADMYWDYDVQKHEYYPMVMDDQFDDTCIRAWSLPGLLDVLPLRIYDEFDRDYELEIDMIDKMPRYIRLGDIYHSQFPYDFEKDTLLDNIVESIVWLNNNNHGIGAEKPNSL